MSRYIAHYSIYLAHDQSLMNPPGKLYRRITQLHESLYAKNLARLLPVSCYYAGEYGQVRRISPGYVSVYVFRPRQDPIELICRQKFPHMPHTFASVLQLHVLLLNRQRSFDSVNVPGIKLFGRSTYRVFLVIQSVGWSS